MPKEWSKQGETHEFLGRLESFLVTLAEKVETTKYSTEVKEICDLLKAIGARPQAQKITAKYL